MVIFSYANHFSDSSEKKNKKDNMNLKNILRLNSTYKLDVFL